MFRRLRFADPFPFHRILKQFVNLLHHMRDKNTTTFRIMVAGNFAAVKPIPIPYLLRVSKWIEQIENWDF